jgi:hypothetical protein
MDDVCKDNYTFTFQYTEQWKIRTQADDAVRRKELKSVVATVRTKQPK